MRFHSASEFIHKLPVHRHQRVTYLHYQYFIYNFNFKFNYEHNGHDNVDVLQLYKYDIHHSHDNIILHIHNGYRNEHEHKLGDRADDYQFTYNLHLRCYTEREHCRLPSGVRYDRERP